MNLTGNTVLITGGTSGIGRALAEAFHQHGNQVVIAGRRQTLLDEITSANPGMRGISVDLEDTSAADALTAAVHAQFPQLNLLINNAGVMKSEDLTTETVDLASAHATLRTNIIGLLHVTAGLLPLLRKQPKSTLINVTSALALVPLAATPTYCASKAFLHSWTQSLRFQLRETSVEVLELIPTYVQTEIGGPQQASDPRAMPLADYIKESLAALSQPNPPNGEILVERAEQLRWAERNGNFDAVFAEVNRRH
jgi:uncharacterized oxidoreductase